MYKIHIDSFLVFNKHWILNDKDSDLLLIGREVDLTNEDKRKI